VYSRTWELDEVPIGTGAHYLSLKVEVGAQDHPLSKFDLLVTDTQIEQAISARVEGLEAAVARVS